MAGSAGLGSIRAVLRQRSYAWYISGSSIALIGIWAQRTTVSWLAWSLTESFFWLSFIVVADLLPAVLLGPFAGVVADRVNRQKMMFNTQALGMLQAFILAGLAFSGLLTYWALFALTLAVGIIWAFNTAARLSLVPNLVELNEVPSAVALDSVMFNLARFFGPSIAGFLFAKVGPGMSFLINGITFSIFLYCLLHSKMIREEQGKRTKASMMEQLKEGLGYAVRHKGIGPILLVIIAIAIGIKPVLDLLSGITETVFQGGPMEFGWLMSATAAGAVIAAFWLAQRGSFLGLTRIVLTAGMLTGIAAILALSQIDWYPLGLAAGFFLGAAIVIGGTGTQTLMQNAVDGAYRGRVMSLYGMIYRGGPALGALAIGALAEHVGISNALLLGVIMSAAAFTWVFLRRNSVAPALETPERND